MAAFLTPKAIGVHNEAKQFIRTIDGIQEHFDKPGRVLVAVERHDKDAEQWREAEPKDRFVWMKAKKKTKVQQVRESYLQQYRHLGSGFSVNLKFNDISLVDEAMVGDCDYIDDHLIVLTNEERSSSTRDAASPSTPSDNANVRGSHPLTNNNRRTPSETPSRQPLQPVNRQLSVPLRQSQEDSPSASESRGARRLLPFPWHEDFVPFKHSTPRHARPEIKSEDDVAPPSSGSKQEEMDANQESQEYEPHQPENPFAVDDDDKFEQSHRGKPLRDLAQEVTPERLEAGVRVGVERLSKLREPLEQLVNNDDAQNWLNQIETVRAEAIKSRTVVGVVGNTGAGKSSVINAMLDEERLVPTNCMRACTAVVTELSYNESTAENARYRAEVEFIQPEEWRKELKVLFEEVFDDYGQMVHEARNPDSTAGIAYAKIRAVYHTFTKDQLSKATVESLMKVKKVQSILGTTKSIKEAASSAFYKRLQSYVDSKEKGTEKLDKNGDKIKNPKREFEFWPLIKVVKIYTKADALSTGAVIVDLPGAHDSNAARAAVAEGYMKQCTGLWIVAPINRAVDDKAAKSLLGNTFKRQLKFDGTYSAVTFICSKTDDISRTEAADSLQLGSEMDKIEEKLTHLEHQRRDLSKQLKQARDDKQDHTDVIDDVEDQFEKWEDLQSKVERGETAYAPKATISKKRKRASPQGARKKRRRDATLDDSDVEYISSDTDDHEEIAANVEGSDESSRTPLTGEQIEEKLEELKALKKNARRQRGDLDEKIKDLRKHLAKVEEEEAECDSRQSELCIAGRNEHSRSSIRQDFAAGIKELDQENAEEEDPDNFNPEEDVRDYDEVARSLPIFCVSSRGYQKLCDRMQKDNDVPGFTTKEQTEIPQLQTHCKKLTERGRQANCRRFLNSLNQLMTSLSLWASDDGHGINLTSQQRDAEKNFLNRRLKELENALEKAVKSILVDISDTLKEQVFEKFRPAIDVAVSEAVPTANKWGGPRNDGGLHFSTYKATVRRSGVFQGASGFQDFNQQLFDPMQKQLASAWEKAFQRRLPHILQSFSKTGSDLLKKFHAAIESRCRERGHGIARIGLLGNQLNAYKAIFDDLASSMIGQVNEGQRDINREFTPVITAAMDPAYQQCADERGTGSYKRMKGHMAEHVDQTKVSMFDSACDQVRDSLAKLLDKVRQHMLDRADSVFVNMQKDYLSVIGGVNVGQITMPREERAIRRELDEIITAVDEPFQKVIDSDLEELPGGDAQQSTEDAIGMDDHDEFESAASEQDSDGNEGEDEDGEEQDDGDSEKEEANSVVDGGEDFEL